MNLSDYASSVIRTIVPAVWGTALAWLVSVGVLDQAAADGPGVAVGGFLVTICIGGFYIVARWLETQKWFPRWVSGILFGTSTAPRYLGAVPVGGTAVDPDAGQHRAR